MSDDKKFTLDDILAEYENKDHDPDGVPDEKAPVPADDKAGKPDNEAVSDVHDDPEHDDYEDGEEQDISGIEADGPMFAPVGLFGEDTDDVPEEKSGDTAGAEETSADDSDDTEAKEELFADDNDDDTEINEELLVEETPDEETSDVHGEAAPDIDEEDTSAAEWSESVAEEAAAYAEILTGMPEEDTGETEDTSAAVQEEAAVPTAAVSDENTEAAEDVNDKWVVRFLKGIFPVKGDSIGEIIRKIIFLIAVIVFIGAGIMLVSTLIQSRAAQDIKEQAKSIITTTAATYIDDEGNVQTIPPTEEEVAQHNFDVAEYYRKINSDYVGYLEVEGCDIYEPVVQGEDNDKYLRTNISGGYNKAGTVFMDYRCTLSEDYTSPNIVLYGHNQEDGTMFGNLKYYKNDPEFYSEHPVVKFSPEYETGEYLIYAFFVTSIYENQDSNGEVFHYHDYIETLNDESTFNWYINEVQKRNQIVSPVDVRFGDKLLCLSTCSNEFTDSRFVVFARKLREDESADDYDFSGAYLNPYAEGVDWDAIMSGETSDSSETEAIYEETEYTTWAKSNGKSNNGSGVKSDERLVLPPDDVTSAPETEETEKTTKKKSKKTETSAEETEKTTKKKSEKTETSAEETSESISEDEETSPEESAVTEVPASEEESPETETAA